MPGFRHKFFAALDRNRDVHGRDRNSGIPISSTGAPASSSARVLVCGAGPAGTIAALSLARNGIPVRIIEKSSEYQAGTRGPGLMPRSLELLSLLGVLPDVLETALGHKGLPRRQYGGHKVVKTWDVMAVEAVSPSTPIPNGLFNAQSMTTAAIRKALEAYGITVELSTEIKYLAQSERDPSVNVHLVKTASDGSTSSEDVEFEYVLGFDGAKGASRKLININFPGESYPEEIIVSDVIIEGLSRDY